MQPQPASAATGRLAQLSSPRPSTDAPRSCSAPPGGAWGDENAARDGSGGGLLAETAIGDRAHRRRHGRRTSRRIMLRSCVTTMESLAGRFRRSLVIQAGSGEADPLRDGRGAAAVALW